MLTAFNKMLLFIFLVCFAGFTGSLCEQHDIRSACRNNPCQYGGTCVLNGSLSSYNCQCPIGRRGTCNTPVFFEQVNLWDFMHLFVSS